jgi:hypothetical protein
MMCCGCCVETGVLCHAVRAAAGALWEYNSVYHSLAHLVPGISAKDVSPSYDSKQASEKRSLELVSSSSSSGSSNGSSGGSSSSGGAAMVAAAAAAAVMAAATAVIVKRQHLAGQI